MRHSPTKTKRSPQDPSKHPLPTSPLGSNAQAIVAPAQLGTEKLKAKRQRSGLSCPYALRKLENIEQNLRNQSQLRAPILVVLPHPSAPKAPASPLLFVLGEESERVHPLLVSALKTKVPMYRKPNAVAPRVAPGQILWFGGKASLDMGLPKSFECQRLYPPWRFITGVATYASYVSDELLLVPNASVHTAIGANFFIFSLPKRRLATTAVYSIDPNSITSPTLRSWMHPPADSPSLWASLLLASATSHVATISPDSMDHDTSIRPMPPQTINHSP